MSTFTKPTGVEKRTLRGTQLRAESQGDEMALVGYAASFNCPSADLGGFREIIAPGAFTRSLAAKNDVRCTFNHDPSKILGRTKSGTLTLEEDSYGLKFRCELDGTSATARDVYGMIKRGDISDCSFAFTVEQADQDWADVADERGKLILQRTLRNLDLFDVSAVTYPAYQTGTAVSARSFDYEAKITDAEWKDAFRRKLYAVDDAFADAERFNRALRLGADIKK